MATRKQIAKIAAKLAAASVYKAIISETNTTKKVAGTNFKEAPPTIRDIAKMAGKAAYLSVLKVAQFAEPQNVRPVGIDVHNIGDALQRVSPAFSNYIQGQEYETNQQVPNDAKAFADYVRKGGKGENWVGADKWAAVVDALVSNVDPEFKDGLRVYLNTL